MARYQMQVDGKVYHMDAEIEERVKALEEAVITLLEAAGKDTSILSANLQSSLDFEVALAEENEAAAIALAAQEEALAAQEAAIAAQMEAIVAAQEKAAAAQEEDK